VKARINQITTLSAHAGKSELVAWAGGSKKVPRKIFLVHGEPEAAKALKKTLEEKMETEVVIPGLNQRELMG
jgi:metallo-beta-lactamase family protein